MYPSRLQLYRKTFIYLSINTYLYCLTCVVYTIQKRWNIFKQFITPKGVHIKLYIFYISRNTYNRSYLHFNKWIYKKNGNNNFTIVQQICAIIKIVPFNLTGARQFKINRRIIRLQICDITIMKEKKMEKNYLKLECDQSGMTCGTTYDQTKFVYCSVNSKQQ